MACRSTDSIQSWIEHAEQLLHVLAYELLRVPYSEARLHVRALELKREIDSWRHSTPPSTRVSMVLDEIEELTRTAVRARKQEGERRSAR